MATTSDTHQSLPLFDPNTEQPPADAVELYLEAPRSLGIFYDAASKNTNPRQTQEMDWIVQTIQQIQPQAVTAALTVLQRKGGYAKVGQHAIATRGQSTIGKYLPASLYISSIFHDLADGRDDIPRFHEHVYVGAQALVDDDGQHWPVDLHALKTQVVSLAQVYYCDAWDKLTTESLGVEWQTVSDLGSVEIVNPPMYQHVGKYPHVMCEGPFRLRQRWISRDVMSLEETRHAV